MSAATAAALLAALVAFAVLTAPAGALASSQGALRTTFASRGIDYAAQTAAEIVQQQIQSLSIPDISGSVGTPVGSVDYDLTSITLSSLEIPSVSASLVSGIGVSGTASNVAAHIHLDWKYREHAWPHVSDSGSADVSVSGTNIQVTVEVGYNKSNHAPTVHTQSVSVSIGNLDITLHGGASWLYSLFVNVFSDQIKHSAENAMQSAIGQVIDQQADSALQSLPITYGINRNVRVDYGLTAPADFSSDFIVSDHFGDFYYTPDPQQPDGSPAAMPETAGDAMFQLFLSDWSMDSLTLAMLQDGKLVLALTQRDMPSWAPIQLNTTAWRLVLPQLYETYPDMPMIVRLQATTAASVVFSTNGALAVQPGYIFVDVIDHSSTVQNAFTLLGQGEAAGSAAIVGANITATLQYLNASMALYNTTIGQFDATVLVELVDILLGKAVVPLINEKLALGVPLPVVDGITFTNPAVAWGDHYLTMTSDISYTPPS